MTRTIELSYEQLKEVRSALLRQLGTIDSIKQEKRYNLIETLYDMVETLETELEVNA